MSVVVRAFSTCRDQSRPWQNNELAEFYRVIDILSRAGLGVVPDMGVSDEGDPWFAFCRADTGDVVVHCARIDGLFIATSIVFSSIFQGRELRDVINSILRSPQFTSATSVAAKRLYLHPAAVFTAFIAAAILFSKEASAHAHHSLELGTLPLGNVPLSKILASFKAFGQESPGVAFSTSGVAVAHDETANLEIFISLAALISADLSIAPISVDLNDQSPSIENLAQHPTQYEAPSFLFDTVALTPDALNSHTAILPQAASPASGSGSVLLSGLSNMDLVVTGSSIAAQAMGDSIGSHSFFGSVDSPAEVRVNYIPAPPLHTATSAVIDQSVLPDQQFLTPAGHVFDPGAVSAVALAMLGIQVTGGGLSTMPGPAAPQFATTPAMTAPSIITSPFTNLGQVTNAVQADSSTAVSVSPTIVIGSNPIPALEQLLDYALGNHPIQSSLTASPLLETILAGYASNGSEPAHLLVFDSTSIKLPIFEFMDGVLFVDDHELGIGPAQSTPGNLVTVDLANGGTMTLLGVVEPPSHTVF